LLSYDSVTYNHDSNGNRTSQTTPSSLTNYSYDFENRLIDVNGGFITYGYLPNGKRISKTVGGVTTYYLYDGDDIIAEYDAAGTLIASYIHGPGVDEPIQMTRAGSTVYYTADGLGSVRDLTNASQAIVEQYSYDAFGNLTAPPTTGNPYTYTAREYDTETGLLFYRARYYDPKVGRFLQQDPKGFDGGDVNFYAYTLNNPINLTDPSGNSPVAIPAIVIGLWLLLENADTANAPTSPCEQLYASTGLQDMAMDAAFDIAATTGLGASGEILQGVSSRLLQKLASNAGFARFSRGLQAKTQAAIAKINNILQKNFKTGPKGDISGAIHDMVGNPIPKPGGGTYDHVADLDNILRGLRNNAEILKNSNDPAAATARQEALKVIQQIEDAVKGAGL
jgi:RHS repeat-associated protein